MENPQNQEKTSIFKVLRGLYEKHYKKLQIIPAVVIIASLTIIFIFYQNHGDIIEKDVSLKGGITATVSTDKEINLQDLQKKLSAKFGDADTRKIAEFGTDRQ